MAASDGEGEKQACFRERGVHLILLFYCILLLNDLSIFAERIFLNYYATNHSTIAIVNEKSLQFLKNLLLLIHVSGLS